MTRPTIQKSDGPIGIQLPLSKLAQEYQFHLTWEVRPEESADLPDFDLDAVAFLLGADGKVAQNRSDNMVFYNTHLLTRNSSHDISSDGSTELASDNRRGGGDGELIKIRVSRIDPAVHSIVLATTIYDAENRRQTFGNVRNAAVEILSVTRGLHHSEGSFDLTHDSPHDTGLVFGRLVRERDNWHFETLAQGHTGGMREIGKLYGIEFSD